jgi:hypothetical protein
MLIKLRWARLAAVLVAVLGLGGITAACSGSTSEPMATAMTVPSPSTLSSTQPRPEPIVGAWSVMVNGAPYSADLFAFMAGGIFASTNPSDVQSAGKNGTNDSVGFGVWQVTPGAPAGTYVGSFIELNADSRTHKPVDSLHVTWLIQIDGDKLTGTAQAALSSAPTKLRTASFTGTRITVDQATLAKIV